MSKSCDINGTIRFKEACCDILFYFLILARRTYKMQGKVCLLNPGLLQ